MSTELKERFLQYLNLNAKKVETDTEEMAEELENIVWEFLNSNCPEGGCLI